MVVMRSLGNGRQSADCRSGVLVPQLWWLRVVDDVRQGLGSGHVMVNGLVMGHLFGPEMDGDDCCGGGGCGCGLEWRKSGSRCGIVARSMQDIKKLDIFYRMVMQVRIGVISGIDVNIDMNGVVMGQDMG